jgi:hypothetical protein
MIFAGPDFVKVHEDANSKVDEIDPGRPFLRINILRWREIFRVIETSSRNVDLIGLVSQRRSTVTAKCPPRSRLRPILARRSFHEWELRTVYYDPSHCLSSGGSPAVSTMTICSNTDLGTTRRNAPRHNNKPPVILFFSMLVTARLACLIETSDNLLVGESCKRP